MRLEKLRIYVGRENIPWDKTVSLHVAMGHAVAQPLLFHERSREHDGETCDPVVRLEPEEAQALMDGLWDCGLRPSEGSGSAGSLAATQRHLEDMRTVAWHALKIREGAKP